MLFLDTPSGFITTRIGRKGFEVHSKMTKNSKASLCKSESFCLVEGVRYPGNTAVGQTDGDRHID